MIDIVSPSPFHICDHKAASARLTKHDAFARLRVITEALQKKHLPGMHDQMTHGRGGVVSDIVGDITGLLEPAMDITPKTSSPSSSEIEERLYAYGRERGVITSTYDALLAQKLKAHVAASVSARMKDVSPIELYEAAYDPYTDPWFYRQTIKDIELAVTGGGSSQQWFGISKNGLITWYEDSEANDARDLLGRPPVKAGTPEARDRVREVAVSQLISTWAQSSNDSNELALALQDAANLAFYLEGTSSWDDRKQASAGELLQKHGEIYRKFLQAQYVETQEMLSALGISEVVLYRGYYANRFDGIFQDISDNEEFQMRPMSSWTLDDDTAYSFSQGYDQEDDNGTGLIFFSVVPAEKVLSTPLTGFGCWEEREFVLLGGTVNGSWNKSKVSREDRRADLIVSYKSTASGEPINIDDSNENADWIKWRTWNMPTDPDYYRNRYGSKLSKWLKHISALPAGKTIPKELHRSLLDDQVKSKHLLGLHDQSSHGRRVEEKARRVRDSNYWGAPVGTPLPLHKGARVSARNIQKALGNYSIIGLEEVKDPAIRALAEEVADFEWNGFSTELSLENCSVTDDSIVWIVSDIKKDGETIGYSTRGFGYGDRYLNNSTLTIDPAYQGQGFAEAYYEHVERIAQREGMTSVQLTANDDVGGYAWARRGFTWITDVDAERIAERVRYIGSLQPGTVIDLGNSKRGEERYAVTPKLRAQARKLVAGGRLPSPAEIAALGEDIPNARIEKSTSAGVAIQMWPGKSIMLSSSWLGEKPIGVGLWEKSISPRDWVRLVRENIQAAESAYVAGDHYDPHDGFTSDYNVLGADLLCDPLTIQSKSEDRGAELSELVALLELKGFLNEVEYKFRRVRDAQYWGMPAGTPIKPGMKPVSILEPIDMSSPAPSVVREPDLSPAGVQMIASNLSHGNIVDAYGPSYSMGVNAREFGGDLSYAINDHMEKRDWLIYTYGNKERSLGTEGAAFAVATHQGFLDGALGKKPRYGMSHSLSEMVAGLLYAGLSGATKSDESFEQKERRVRTEAGRRRYGQEIGEVIRPDLIPGEVQDPLPRKHRTVAERKRAVSAARKQARRQVWWFSFVTCANIRRAAQKITGSSASLDPRLSENDTSSAYLRSRKIDYDSIAIDLLDGIDASDPYEGDLYRSVFAPLGYIEQLQIGSTVEAPLLALGDDRENLERYFGDPSAIVGKEFERVTFVFERPKAVKGKAHSTEVILPANARKWWERNGSDPRWVGKESGQIRVIGASTGQYRRMGLLDKIEFTEYVTGGKFKVRRVKKKDGITVVTLQQIDTFSVKSIGGVADIDLLFNFPLNPSLDTSEFQASIGSTRPVGSYRQQEERAPIDIADMGLKLERIINALEAKERRVRTQAGSDRFGQPIGSIIRAGGFDVPNTAITANIGKARTLLSNIRYNGPDYERDEKGKVIKDPDTKEPIETGYYVITAAATHEGTKRHKKFYVGYDKDSKEWIAYDEDENEVAVSKDELEFFTYLDQLGAAIDPETGEPYTVSATYEEEDEDTGDIYEVTENVVPLDRGNRNPPAGMRAATKEERDAYGCAPAWVDVWLWEDASGKKTLGYGFDDTNRRQYIQVRTQRNQTIAENHVHISGMRKPMPKFDKQWKQDIENDETARVICLLRQHGMRVGKGGNTRSAVDAFGATMLLSEHVTLNKTGSNVSSVTFDFPAKGGKRVHFVSRDPHVIRAMSLAKIGKRKGQQLFPDTNYSRVSKYIKDHLGPQYSPHDLRTYLATSIAASEVLKLRGQAYDDPKQLEKAMLSIAGTVSSVLHNTPSVALGTYIAPSVFYPISPDPSMVDEIAAKHSKAKG